MADVVEEALQDLSIDIDFALYDQEAKVEQRFLGQYQAASKTVGTTEESIRSASSVCSRPKDCTRLLILGQR